jgi:uncharacterized protein YbjT (DUF2867 family)
MSEAPILVTGATGTVGSEAVRLLAAAGHPVRALVRDRSKASRLDPRAEIVTGDLNVPESLPPAFAGVEKAFVISNVPNIAALEINAFNAARKAGVKYVAKLSGIPVYMDVAKDSYLVKEHLESEDYLRRLGVAWTMIRPGYFMSNMLMWGVPERGTLTLPAGSGRHAPVDPRDIAAVAARVLTSTGHDSAVYDLTGPELLSDDDMLQQVAAVIGKPLQFIDVPPEVWRDEAIGAGTPPAFAYALLKYFTMVKNGEMAFVKPTVRQVLGRDAGSFKAWLESSPLAVRAVSGQIESF